MKLTDRTAAELVRENALRYKAETALETPEESFSFEELYRGMENTARALTEELQIEKGTHIGIWSVNTPEFVFLFLALLRIGAVPVPINTCYRERETADVLDDMDIHLLFYGKGWKDLDYGKMLPGVLERCSREVKALPLEGFVRGGQDDRAFCRRRPEEGAPFPAAEDIACIIMTSGTTVHPKGVLLTHKNIVNCSLAAAENLRWHHGLKMCIALPMFHCFGLITGVVGCISSGMCMYVLPFFRTEAVWRAVLEKGCTVLNGVPSMYLALIRKEGYRDIACTTLHSGIVGGAMLLPEDYLEICRHFPGMHLQTSYGMTEASPSISFVDWDAPLSHKAKSCGRLLEGMEGRICSVDTGELLPAGQAGEIQLKGFNITQGYYKRPEENERAFAGDGWFRTGDIGYFDEAGELHLTGRLKELIIRAGENISGAEIEQEILRSGMASGAKVVGVSAGFRQEEIAACVVPSRPESFRTEELLGFLRTRLAVFKIPAYVIVLDSLPMTASGKADLKAVKELAEEYVRTGKEPGHTDVNNKGENEITPA